MSLIKGKQLSNPFQYSGSFIVTGSVVATSFTGSISASSIVGLNLDNSRIATGSITASVADAGFSIVSGSRNLLFVSSSGRINIGGVSSSLDLVTISGSGGITWTSLNTPFVNTSRIYTDTSDNLRFFAGLANGRTMVFEGAGITFESSGSGFASFNTKLRVTAPGNADRAALITGPGLSSTTYGLVVQNASAGTGLSVLDNQYVGINTAFPLAPFHISSSITQPVTSGSTTYNILANPRFTNTAPNQIQTAFRLNPTFTGSFSGSNTTNIIADFGASNIGTQLLVNDVISGSIYLVNDISGLPIIEATSDWVFNLYEYPNVIFQKSGSALKLGLPRTQTTSSTVTIQSDTIINEGYGFVHRTTQVSGSTLGVATSSLFTVPLASSATAYLSAVITGYDTTLRTAVVGEIKASFKRAGGNALLIGTGSKYINTDGTGVPANFDFVVGSTSGSLLVYGSGSGLYDWKATITTQIV